MLFECTNKAFRNFINFDSMIEIKLYNYEASQTLNAVLIINFNYSLAIKSIL